MPKRAGLGEAPRVANEEDERKPARRARTHHGGDGVGELLRAGGAHARLVHQGGERALFVAGEGEDRVAGPRRHARVKAGYPPRVLHLRQRSEGTEWEMKPQTDARGANENAERERGTKRARPHARKG